MQENGTILIVEDDPDIVDVLRELLEDNAYRVVTASNGWDALLALKSRRILPSLILLDLMMPVMNGFEFRMAQMEDEILSKIPVIVMTADGQVEEKQKRLNATAFIKKPLEIKGLLSALKKYRAS